MSPKELTKILNEKGVTIGAEFVPFSQSRNKDNKHKSLNWRVTLAINGRAVYSTDYFACICHCPAYKSNTKDNWIKNNMIDYECEYGHAATYWNSSGNVKAKPGTPPILPNAADVMYSLLIDAEALDYASFEDWSSEFGYDPDSRKAEAIYKECLACGLALRNGLGNALLDELRDLFTGY